jgi:hypothetical protein
VTRAQVTALLGLAVITWGAWLLFAGVSVGLNYLAPFSLTVGVIVGSVSLFNLYLWRWPGFQSMLSDRPILRGTWQLEIESNFVDEATGQRKRVEGYYLIRQTYSQLSIRLLTKETTSKTLCAQLVKSEDGEWTLQGTFLDTPAVSLRGQSSIHYGAFWLRLSGDPVSSFHGQYWTDRNTKGTVRSIAYIPTAIPADFDAAVRQFKDAQVSK